MLQAYGRKRVLTTVMADKSDENNNRNNRGTRTESRSRQQVRNESCLENKFED